MKPRLLLTTILLCQTLRTYHALTCLKCSNVAQPRHCETVMTCQQKDDVCFVERRTNDFGEEGYALGCISQLSCHNTTSFSPTSSCSQCCDRDLCNQEGCGEIGFPTNRGPVCYNCHSPLPEGRCHNVDICRTGEVCSVTGKEKFGTPVFTSQCLPSDDCGAHYVGLIIGKRDSVTEQFVRTVDPNDCFQCCSSDLCNRNCKIQGDQLLDGQWSSWTTWSLCSSYCNQTRTRACDNPAPLHGGRDCQGLTTQTQSCYTDECPVDGQWGSWTKWSLCTSHCNETRTRACDNPAPLPGGSDCLGNMTQTQICYTDKCAVDGQWGSWTTWSSCTSHCNQTRSLVCNNPAPLHGGSDCLGNMTQTQSCYTDQCTVDGQWGSWTAWSLCTSHCNQTRSRACNNPAPLPGGRDCSGNMTQTQSCYTDQCPVDGQWSSWTTWSSCTSHCDQTRTRACNDPAPLHGGRDCPGNTKQTQSCYTDQCAVDGHWGSWTTWSSCTSHCNQTRSRVCNNPAPLHGGRDCPGNMTQTQICYTDQCPVDGQWGSWTSWSLCNALCNQTRTRACDNPAPLPGGRDCPGHSGQTQDCDTSKCSLRDCSELLKNDDSRQRGVYTITTPLTHTKIQVFCDMEMDGGGWTVFQKRFNGSENFYRNLSDYENGFGWVYGKHWLGLRYMYEIVSQGGHQLRLDFLRSNGSRGFDVYGNFSLQSRTNYTLHIGSRLRFSGCVSLIADPNGTPSGNAFSTYDNDVDRHNSGDCAKYGYGGWWYNFCFQLNPNGLYRPGQKDASVMSYSGEEGLEAMTMMFKPI